MIGLHYDGGVRAYFNFDMSHPTSLSFLIETVEQTFGRLNLFVLDTKYHHTEAGKPMTPVQVMRFVAMRGWGDIGLSGKREAALREDIAICKEFDLTEYFLSEDKRVFFRPAGVREIAVIPPAQSMPDHHRLAFHLSGAGGKTVDFPITQDDHLAFTVGFVKSHRYPEVLHLQNGLLKKKLPPES